WSRPRTLRRRQLLAWRQRLSWWVLPRRWVLWIALLRCWKVLGRPLLERRANPLLPPVLHVPSVLQSWLRVVVGLSGDVGLPLLLSVSVSVLRLPVRVP